jgi:hypothetical protein
MKLLFLVLLMSFLLAAASEGLDHQNLRGLGKRDKERQDKLRKKGKEKKAKKLEPEPATEPATKAPQEPATQEAMLAPQVPVENVPSSNEVAPVLSTCPNENPCPPDSVCNMLTKPDPLFGVDMECKCKGGFFPSDVYNEYGPMECYSYPLFQVAPMEHSVDVYFVNDKSGTPVTVTLEDNAGNELRSESCSADACEIKFRYTGYESCEYLQIVLLDGDDNEFSLDSELKVMYDSDTVIYVIATDNTKLGTGPFTTSNCPAF